MIGNVLAVQVTTISNSCSRSGSTSRVIASAPKRSASARPRSSVRLATVTDRGLRVRKWLAASSIISPAPTKRIRRSEIEEKIRSASLTAAAAIETDAVPMSVRVRTSFATANVRWNSRLRTRPSEPADSAERTACFI